MDEDIQIASCPDCGAGGARSLYRDRKYSVLECPRCRALYCSPRTLPGFQAAYGEEYYRTNYLPVEARSIAYYRKRILPVIRKVLPEGGRILDIGCGAGFFLKAAKDAGYRVTGVDPSEFASAYCRDHWGIDCRTGFFEELSLGKYDMITMFNMLAHVTSDKRDLLAKVGASLDPGGQVLVKTVCWNRNYPILCGLLPHEGLKRLCLHLPQQYYFYHAGNIGACLANGGFKISYLEKCFGEWSVLRGMDPARKKASLAIAFKWLIQKAVCGPLRTDMLVIAGKEA